MKALKKLQLTDDAVSRFQDNVEEALKPIIAASLIDGLLLPDIDLISGQDNNVSHKLGRIPLGYIPVKRSASSTIWDQASTAPSSLLNLHCSTSCTVSLWVF